MIYHYKYIQFELYGLDRAVSNYKFALNLVHNRRREAFEHLTVDQKQTIANSATILYGLIHARFIITKRGLEKMKRKYISNDFGLCQRNNCNEHSLLPTAITDEKGKECVRLYCSNCCDIYLPIKECYKNIDGSYFGTTFAHLFLLSFPIFKPKQSILDCRTPKYTPKIFGFRLHKTWHNIALKEWNQKHYANNEFEHKQMNKIVNDTQSNEVHYLMKVKGSEFITAIRNSFSGNINNVFPNNTFSNFYYDDRIASLTANCKDAKMDYIKLFNISANDSSIKIPQNDNELLVINNTKYSLAWARYIFSEKITIGLTASAPIIDKNGMYNL